MSTVQAAYPWRFKNVGATTIPKFGAIRITGYEKDEERGLVLLAKEPDDTKEDPAAVNASLAVAPNKYGLCMFAPLAWAEVEGTTEHNDTLGQKKSKAGLVKDEPGFQQIGAKDSTLSAVLVFRGSGGGSSTKARAMITGGIPAASFDGAAKEVTPGISGDDVATVLKWNDAGDKMEEDTDIGTIKGANVASLTAVRASTSEPVVLSGSVEEVNGEDMFVVDPFDLRALPGYVKGAGGTQIPYHLDSEEAFQLGGELCE